MFYIHQALSYSLINRFYESMKGLISMKELKTKLLSLGAIGGAVLSAFC